MTKKEAIKRLQRCKRNLELGKVIGAVSEEGADERIEAFDFAIKALERNEWIPVGERLPDYMEDTLVTIQVNNKEPKVRSGFYARGCFHNDNGDTWNWNDSEVKAWMPKPEPYTAEREIWYYRNRRKE